jgi:hypothetical protein
VTNLEVMTWPVTGGECLSRNKLAGVDGGEPMDEQQPGGEDRDVNELAGGGERGVMDECTSAAAEGDGVGGVASWK